MATTAFPINPVLTAIAMVYSNPAIALIADEVMPRTPTAKKFAWSSYDVGQGYSVPQTLVGRKSLPTEVDFTGSLINDEVLDYGLDDIVPNDEVEAFNSTIKPASGGPIDPLSISAMLTTKLIGLDREIRVAGRVFNAANYPAANQQTRMFEATIEEISKKFTPDLVLISAGFDAHESDPLGQLRLEDEDFISITKTVMQWADDVCDGRIVSCLEGGYNLDTLGETVKAHIGALNS